jgi:hypothetical protein
MWTCPIGIAGASRGSGVSLSGVPRCWGTDTVLTGECERPPEHPSGRYHEAVARHRLSEELGMRPLAAHCHLGLSNLYRRVGKRGQAQEHLCTAATMYREMGMNFWLEKARAERKALG